jgi:hypothetical protein
MYQYLLKYILAADPRKWISPEWPGTTLQERGLPDNSRDCR